MVIAFADMVHIFLRGRRSDKVEGDILLSESLHQQLRHPLVAEFVSFLALKLGLLLHVEHRANTQYLPEKGRTEHVTSNRAVTSELLLCSLLNSFTTSGDAHAGLFLKAGQLLSGWFLK
jgi:hypothetical protein